jgi:hypothetical protein
MQQMIRLIANRLVCKSCHYRYSEYAYFLESDDVIFKSSFSNTATKVPMYLTIRKNRLIGHVNRSQTLESTTTLQAICSICGTTRKIGISNT